MHPDDQNHADAIAALRKHAADTLAGRIITVASDKGGLGKSTLAVELAYCLGAVLIDADWHDGGASRSLGWRHEQRSRSPLLDALDRDRVPKPLTGGTSRPDLVPAGPDMESKQPTTRVMADALVAWGRSWQRPVVVDTHPGGGAAANGAVEAAHTVVSPVPLFEKELEALQGWVALMDGYPLVIVPNRVPRVPPARQLDWLSRIADTYELPVTTPIPESVTWLARRRARTAVCSTKTLSSKSGPLVSAFVSISEEVAEQCRTA